MFAWCASKMIGEKRTTYWWKSARNGGLLLGCLVDCLVFTLKSLNSVKTALKFKLEL